MSLVPNNTQWSAIVDLTNVSVLHDFHDVKVDRPDLQMNLSVGEEGFTLEVSPVTNADEVS